MQRAEAVLVAARATGRNLHAAAVADRVDVEVIDFVQTQRLFLAAHHHAARDRLDVAITRSTSAATPMPARIAVARTHALLHIDQLNEALRYIADWIVVCASDGNIEHVLAAADGKAGLDRRELVGRSLWTFTADLHHDALAQSPHANGIAVTLTTFGATPETAIAVRIGGDDAKIGADLRWLSELTRRAAESVRGVSRQLGARQFENSDIAALLAHLCEDTAIAFEVECRLHAEDASDEFRGASASAKRHIFRFAQESLNNALRHGHANLVVMRLEARRQRLRLTILDNGSGFDLRRFTGAARRGLGLHSMRMRASIIGGRLHIRTGSYGTLVMLVAPVAALSEA